MVASRDPSMQTISEKLLAECRSETADIEVVRGYLEQEDCDVNIRDDDVCNMVYGYTCYASVPMLKRGIR